LILSIITTTTASSFFLILVHDTLPRRPCPFGYQYQLSFEANCILPALFQQQRGVSSAKSSSSQSFFLPRPLYIFSAFPRSSSPPSSIHPLSSHHTLKVGWYENKQRKKRKEVERISYHMYIYYDKKAFPLLQVW
jgi:hypothetical protein